MADYTPLLTRAVAGQDQATRAGIYARAREALERQLRAFEPRLDEAQIRTEIEGLDKAIEAVEASLHLPVALDESIEAAPPAKPAAPPFPVRGSAGRLDAFTPAAQEAPSAPPLDEATVLGNNDSTDDVAPPSLREPIITPVLRPKMPLRHEGRNSRRLLVYAALGAFVVMLGIGTMALFDRDNQDPLHQASQPQTSTVEPSKTEGRLAGDSAARGNGEEPVAAQNPAPTQSSVDKQQQQASASTRAFMVLESPGNAPSQFEGAALWAVEADNANPGQKALRMLIAFPGAEMTVDMTLSRNNDKSITASHLMIAVFEMPKGTEPVRELSPLEWRERETIQGAVLRGAVVPVQDNIFMLTLDKAAEAANLDLMLHQKWIVFEFRLANGRRGAVLVEKGASGERAVAEAIAAWK